jgi:hypothetical protein
VVVAVAVCPFSSREDVDVDDDDDDEKLNPGKPLLISFSHS